MNKYLVIEIQTNKDEAIGNLVFAFDTWNEAQSKYHYVLAAAAVSGLPVHAAMLVDNHGGLLESMAYETKEEGGDEMI